MRKFLSNSVIAALMTILSTGLSSEGNAMGSKPETKTILVSCAIEGSTSEVSDFVEALCPAFTKAIAERWPEANVSIYNSNMHDSAIIIELNATISSPYSVQTHYKWAKGSEWAAGNINATQPTVMNVNDVKLNAYMTQNMFQNDIERINLL